MQMQMRTCSNSPERLFQLAVAGVHPLSGMASSSIGMLAVKEALRLLTVSLSTALVTVDGLATVNLNTLAYVLAWVVLLLPTHTLAGLPYDVLLLEPALTCVEFTAVIFLRVTAAAGMVRRTSSSAFNSYNRQQAKGGGGRAQTHAVSGEKLVCNNVALDGGVPVIVFVAGTTWHMLLAVAHDPTPTSPCHAVPCQAVPCRAVMC